MKAYKVSNRTDVRPNCHKPNFVLGTPENIRYYSSITEARANAGIYCKNHYGNAEEDETGEEWVSGWIQDPYALAFGEQLVKESYQLIIRIDPITVN